MTHHPVAHRNTRFSSGTGRASDHFWPVLRDLIEARAAFGLRRPVITTLRALISFLEEGSMVFASNRSIMTRAEGISESALRRHIKALVDLGFVIRHDSSNGKRYRMGAEGQEDMIFGLDLSPLDAARDRIAEAAEESRRENRMIRYLRKQLGQLIFHARSLGHPETEIHPYQAALRQKLSARIYEGLCDALRPLANCLDRSPAEEAHPQPEIAITSKMTATGSQNDCHKNITEERSLTLVQAKAENDTASDQSLSDIGTDAVTKMGSLSDPSSDALKDHKKPLQPDAVSEMDPLLLRKAKALAPDALAFADESPKSWQEVESLAWRLASWSGISPALLSAAIETAGRRMTAMAVLTVTQNAGRIRNPGAYFRTLTMGRHFPRFARPLAHLS